MPEVFQVHSFLSKLKPKNEGTGREKWGYSSGQLSRLPRTFGKESFMEPIPTKVVSLSQSIET